MRSLWKKSFFITVNSSKKIIKIFNKSVIVDKSSVINLFYVHNGKDLQHVLLKSSIILRRLNFNFLSFFKKKDVLHKFKSIKNNKKSSKQKIKQKLLFKFL